MSTTYRDAEMPRQITGEATSQISNPRARNRVETAAYLLGASREMPGLTDDEIRHQQAIQACYSAMAGGTVPNLESYSNSLAVDGGHSDETCKLTTCLFATVYLFYTLFSSLSHPHQYDEGQCHHHLH
jgi:hypothetical protein